MRQIHSNKPQRGAVLLSLTIVISLVGVLWLYSNLATHHRNIRTQQALNMAQSALIGRAVADLNRAGSLPCPDTNNDGVAELLTGVQCPSYIGRLPWRTLGLSDVRDDAGERLWYALSPDVRDASGNIVNSALTTGQLLINANAQQVAIVFAPNAVITPQARDGAQQNNVSQYLDGSNADGDTHYESRQIDDSGFNDHVRAISQIHLFKQVEKHALQQFAVAIQQYDTSHHVYPYAGNATGEMQSGLLSGFIPYATLALASSAWAQNLWFTALDAVPYSVDATLGSVQLRLRYCQANVTRGQVMQVQCG
ncbi:hypothetical protein SFSGTM_28560 [Sulfuriferula nivalis]|uniref:Uncharacterized protein n=2 Tax=Sulfuriferula nivalis TaxID=2675298 RepID=A0A809S4Y0_9PROT|nr:hypothetical protein SFSGTM_28560 [Sulfuriferula nivalis]